MREMFRAPPTDLRNRRHRADRFAADGRLTLRLPVVPQLSWVAKTGRCFGRRLPGQR
jgi:AraC family transcriptional regulator of adaptative response / DNA-3-methyladenine glycosylase II